MQNRVQKMEEFLQKYRNIIVENPTLKIDDDFFYAQLMYYDMSIDEIYNSMARENFSVWEDQFKNKENIDVYVSEYQKKFCQFHSKQLTKGNSDYIKMYFSFSKKDLCECTTEIFEFVEANNIAHLSKVGERQRADSVILRLEKMEDAELVQKFIDSNEKLKSKMRNVNPFIYNKSGVGYALDGLLSYNSILSNIMSSYFEKHKAHNSLDQICLADFRNHIINFYNSTFAYCDNLNSFANSELFSASKERGTVPKLVTNFEEVYKLMISATSSADNFNEYLENFSYCKDEMRRKRTENAFANRLNIVNKEISNEMTIDNNTKPEINQKRQSLQKDILDAYIQFAINEHGVEYAIEQLQKYMFGNINAITRTNDFRNLFKDNLSKEAIDNILVNASIRSYVSQFKAINKAQLLEKASLYTYQKYGIEQLSFAISAVVNSGNFNCFSEGIDQYRTQLKQHFDKEHLKSTIIETLINNGKYKENELYIYSYCDYIANMVNEKESEKVI